MRVFRRVASALALYGVPLLLVAATLLWFGLRVVRDVDPPIITTTSTAMKPTVHPIDLVFVAHAKRGSIGPGDVIALRDANGDVTMRRVVSIANDGTYLLRGDDRPDTETTNAAPDRVIGRVGLRLPLLGFALVLLRTVAGQVLLAAICIFGFAGAMRSQWARRHPHAMEETPHHVPELPGPSFGPMKQRIRVAPDDVAYGGAGMSITPAELRHVRFAQVRRGYDTEAVDRALESVADSIEELLHERHEMVERMRQLESEIERYRDVEQTLSETLQLAERAADELKAEAKVEAERMMGEARQAMAAAQQLAAQAAAAPPSDAAAPTSSMPDPAFIELLGETRAIRSLLQALMTQNQGGGTGSPFSPRPSS
jgi:signal peptidase I